MIVSLYYVIPEMDSFPMSVANNLCDKLLPKYLDSKTVLIYCPHPVVRTLLTVNKSHGEKISSCIEWLKGGPNLGS